MFTKFDKKTWLYHRGEWSRINNPLYDAQLTYADFPRHTTWRQALKDYNRNWGNLGPVVLPHVYYTGIRVRIYCYTGNKKMPEFLIRIISLRDDELIYAQDLPDLLEVLDLLAPLVTSGVFSDAYMQAQNSR